MAAATQMQAPLRIHLVTTLRRAQHQDLIRYHGGPDVDIVAHVRPEDALQAVAESSADMALWPVDDGSGALTYVERRFLSALAGQTAWTVFGSTRACRSWPTP